jgi:hypothetical protein
MRTLSFTGSFALAVLTLACSAPDRVFADPLGAGGSGAGVSTSSNATGNGGNGGNGGSGGNQSSTLALSAPAEVVVRVGAAVDVEIAVARTGSSTDPAVITAEGLPTGVTADPLSIAADAPTGTLTLHGTAAALQGLATATVIATAGALLDDATIDLVVAGAPGTPDVTFAASGTFQTQVAWPRAGAGC